MELIDKATILAELYEVMPEHDIPFIYDITIVYAVGLSNGDILQLSAEQESIIETMWTKLCEMYDADPNAEYSVLDDVVPRSEIY
jgi:hypothetical protein